MVKQEDVEMDANVDVSVNGTTVPDQESIVVKREVTPIDIDMLASGNKDSPIYISSGDTASDVEVDAQMDDVESESQDYRDDELEYVEPTHSSAPNEKVAGDEGREPSLEQTGELAAEQLQDPVQEMSRGVSLAPQEASAKEATRELSEQPADDQSGDLFASLEKT